MAYLLIGNAVVLSALAIGRHQRLSLFSPFMLHAFVWQMVFAAGLAVGHRFYPLTESTFTMWIIWFSVSGLLYFLFSLPAKPQVTAVVRAIPIDYTLALMVLIVWLLYHIRSTGLSGPAHFFFNLRFATTQNVGFTSLGFLDRVYPWALALFAFELVNEHDGNRLKRRLLWCVMVLYAMATMAKLGLLTPILVWAVIRGTRGGMPMRRLLLVVPIVIVFMVAIQYMRDVKGEQFSVAKLFGVYTYSPLVAFGYMNPAPSDAPWGAHVFRLLYVIHDALLGDGRPVSAIQPIIAVPFTTNVYTAMRPFALDFGYPGVFLGALAYGLVLGGAYYFAIRRRQFATVIYAGLCVVIIGQFFDDLLFTMLAGQLQFVVAAFFFSMVSRRSQVHV